MDYVISPAAVATLAVAGTSQRFPVRRIYTIGRNYAAHAAETGLGGPGGSRPGVALKPADSVVAGGGEVLYPPGTTRLEPEVEMVAAIGAGGAMIPRATALAHVFGYAVGLDLIRRDLLEACIRDQHPWDLCKSFDGASPCGTLARAAEIGHPGHGAITLAVNGIERQRGDLADMVWDVAEIVERLSALSRLEAGDIIFTGTPRGPAPVERGDQIDARIEGVGELAVTIV